MVEIEKLDDGQWRVSRVLPCLSSSHAAAMALERIVPAAFAPVSAALHMQTPPMLPALVPEPDGMEHAP